MPNDPQIVTVAGRLSWPRLTMEAAIAGNLKSKFPVAADKLGPSVNIVVEQSQVDKIVAHARDTFLPWCVEQQKNGETRSALTQAQADEILAFLEAGDWEAAPPHTPIKHADEKLLEKVPTAAATIKVSGRPGQNFIQQVHVRDESDLAQGQEVKNFPALLPIGQTVHELYAGCDIAVTLNMYAFVASKVPGFTASATTIVFKRDNVRFGGGTDVDEDSIFMDED